MTTLVTLFAQASVETSETKSTGVWPAIESYIYWIVATIAASYLIVTAIVAAIGLLLMLPPTSARRRMVGAVIVAASLVPFGFHLPAMGGWGQQLLFWAIAGIAILAAVATITMRSPVYSAIWFAVTLLATAGLFILQHAPFLGVATIIVYAGAILVTFLFVLMLAQPEGHTYYDRISWGSLAPLFATLSGAVMVCAVAYAVAVFTAEEQASLAVAGEARRMVAEPTDPSSDSMVDLGRELFSRHLLSVELAGTLLLVALVGAIAIVIQTQASRGEQLRE